MNLLVAAIVAIVITSTVSSIFVSNSVDRGFIHIETKLNSNPNINITSIPMQVTIHIEYTSGTHSAMATITAGSMAEAVAEANRGKAAWAAEWGVPVASVTWATIN